MTVVSGAQRRRGRVRSQSERTFGLAAVAPQSGPTDPGPEVGEEPRDGDVIELVLPARNKYLAAARLVASAVASDLDFTVDDLDELRIAIDEAMAVLIAAEPSSTAIRIRFSAAPTAPGAPSRLLVEGEPTERRITTAAPPVDALVSHIMAAVTDRFVLGPDRFEFVKSASHPADSTH
jgi:serine/threonine-protein kinase RsbW